MIKQETQDGIVRTYSDSGKKIKPKGAKLPVANNAYEPQGKAREWVEVEE